MKSFNYMMTSAVTKNLRTWVASLLAVSLMTSCIKNKFDEPPVNGTDPNLTPTMTIAEFKQLYTGTSLQIQDSVILSGIIIADDRSGNFYKTLVIEDSTAGIAIRLDQTGLYNNYMIGRRIYIKAKGLYLGAYANLIQIGGAATAGSMTEVDAIPSTLISKHIVRGSLNNPITPTTVNITQLGSSFQNRLIRLENVQFSPADTGFTYANGTLQLSKNTTIQDCNGNSIVLRSSGFASFADAVIPSGRGTLTAVYSVFNNTPQLFIRDLYDVQFDQPRCGSGGGGGNIILLEEKFDGFANNAALTMPGWSIVAEVGTLLWRAGTATAVPSSPFAKCSAFSSSGAFPVVKTWLISPEIDLTQTTQEQLEFKGGGGWDNGATLRLFVSQDYISGNPNTATWTELNFNPLPTRADGFPSSFGSSGLVDLNSFDGIIRLGWLYEGGNNTNQTTTWQIDDIVVKGNQ